MLTPEINHASARLWKFLGTCLLIASAVFSVTQLCRAGLPEPDNIVYGLIYIGTNQVTVKSTNVIVEAWLATNGPTIASYTMGSLPTAGNYYSLRVSLENTAPSTAAATETGQPVYVVVRDKTSVYYQQLITVGSRLAIQRLDFGQVPTNGLDTNSLPFAWENYYFGRSGLNPGALTLNGQTILQNYIAGTSPNSATDTFNVSVTLSNRFTRVSFATRAATGIGYNNVSRHYTLEGETNVANHSWVGLVGFTNILGAGQTVVYTTPATNQPAFYRGKVWLQSP